MAGSSGKNEWYLARDGQQHGPLSEAELDKFIELGHLRPNDLLWRVGFDDWRLAADVFPPLPPTPAGPAEPKSEKPAATAAPGEPTPEKRGLSELKPVRSGAERQAADPQSAAQSDRSGEKAAEGPAKDPADEHGGRQPAAQPEQRQSANGQHRRADDSEAPEPEDWPKTKVVRPEQGVTAAGPTSQVHEFGDDLAEEDERGSAGSFVRIALILLVVIVAVAGGWLAFSNQRELASLYSDFTQRSDESSATIVRAPSSATREAADPANSGTKTEPGDVAKPSPTTTAAINAPAQETASLPPVPLLTSEPWRYAEASFANWTSEHTETARRMAVDGHTKEDINDALIKAFVRFRRDNAEAALLAPADSLKAVAEAFVINLETLKAVSPNMCYAFISSGESAPEVASLFFDEAARGGLEAQMLTIFKAVVDARSSQTRRDAPVKADFETLAKDLARQGWTQADLELFSDPKALSRAQPDVVCRLVTQWFSTQTQLADPVIRDRLIAASLRPVIGG